jgi:predicted methyltransferase
MRHSTRLLASLLIGFSIATAAKEAPTPKYITNAIADAKRPTSDTDQDANRKPVAVLTFAEVKPGETVVDLLPGGGYYTRLFSKAVGPKGTVYGVTPDELLQKFPKALDGIKSIAGTDDYKNVTSLQGPAVPVNPPKKADIIFTSMNYHDYHNPLLGSPDMMAFNKSVLNALKPGGLFIVLDHAAAADSGFAATNTTHRIDPAAAKAEILAAGFEFVGESDALRNPEDDHTLSVFDKSLRGKTDRFIYKFRKPKH